MTQSLPCCEVCGRTLNGVQALDHSLLLVRDGLMVHGGHYCGEHLAALELAFKRSLRALRIAADEATRELAREVVRP